MGGGSCRSEWRRRCRWRRGTAGRRTLRARWSGCCSPPWSSMLTWCPRPPRAPPSRPAGPPSSPALSGDAGGTPRVPSSWQPPPSFGASRRYDRLANTLLILPLLMLPGIIIKGYIPFPYKGLVLLLSRAGANFLTGPTKTEPQESKPQSPGCLPHFFTCMCTTHLASWQENRV